MAEASKDPDQSMEDILQSIKRIIADEGEPATAAGSDVLELTELLAEDAASAPVEKMAIDEEPIAPTLSIDDIMNAPISAMPQEPIAAPAPEPMPVMQMQPEPEPVFTPEPVDTAPAAAPASAAAALKEDTLMSDATVAASMAALNALATKSAATAHAHTSLAFRSGETVEDLVIEALRPMLKEWLDNNLPSMVRTLVEKEIRRLSS